MYYYYNKTTGASQWVRVMKPTGAIDVCCPSLELEHEALLLVPLLLLLLAAALLFCLFFAVKSNHASVRFRVMFSIFFLSECRFRRLMPRLPSLPTFQGKPKYGTCRDDADSGSPT